MGKGSGRRPTQLTQDAFAQAWARTFSSHDHGHTHVSHDPTSAHRSVYPVRELSLSDEDGEDSLLEARHDPTDARRVDAVVLGMPGGSEGAST